MATLQGMAQFIWYDNMVFLCKPELPPIELREGDFIRSSMFPEGIKIVKFYGYITEVGPRGFTYLPWLSHLQRWACPSISEDPRYILCEPAGISHSGIPMCAETIEKHPLPD